MCTRESSSAKYQEKAEKPFRLAAFFNRWWDLYKQHPAHFITAEQYKAVNALRCCRTEAYGVDHYVCPECGEITQVYHSCKHRFCPTCSWIDTLKWAERLKKGMLNLPHRHVVVTLPHALNGLLKMNGSLLLDVLMRTSSYLFKDWMFHKYQLKTGIITVLHTFGETKEYHCHVHMIVSWGGIATETGALLPLKGTYVNYNFLKDKFREDFEKQLIKLFESGELVHAFKDISGLRRFLRRINQKRWILHLEPPVDIPTEVIRYIGRYTKRACLSEYKITGMEGETIRFRYKDNKVKDVNNRPVERELELHYRDFFPRLLQHVPLKYFRLVRYYGVYANRSHLPEAYLYREDQEELVTSGDQQAVTAAKKETENPLECPYCHTWKLYLYTTVKKRGAIERITFRRKNVRPSKIPLDQVA